MKTELKLYHKVKILKANYAWIEGCSNKSHVKKKSMNKKLKQKIETRYGCNLMPRDDLLLRMKVTSSGECLAQNEVKVEATFISFRQERRLGEKKHVFFRE